MRECPVCHAQVVGRKDKVFCSPTCRAAQQYEVKQKNEAFYHQVDRQLKKNRSILKRHNHVGKTTLRKEVLLAEGFNPKFFTHYWKTHKGEVYLFCYEYGFHSYQEQGKDKYVLITWQPYMEKH